MDSADNVGVARERHAPRTGRYTKAVHDGIAGAGCDRFHGWGLLSLKMRALYEIASWYVRFRILPRTREGGVHAAVKIAGAALRGP
jgi:hypothetical protein